MEDLPEEQGNRIEKNRFTVEDIKKAVREPTLKYQDLVESAIASEEDSGVQSHLHIPVVPKDP